MNKEDYNYTGSETFRWYDSPLANNVSTMTFTQPPKPVGAWVMPGGSEQWQTKFMAYKKPRWLVRWSMRYVLGWKWEDAA